MTLLIILITCLVSFAAFSNQTMMEKYKFSPYKVNRNGEHIRWISHGFLHADINHLLFNMIALFCFGNRAESIFMPNIVFIAFYLLAIIVSSIPDYIQHKNNPYYSSVGASGAINSVLFSAILLSPWMMINLIIPAILFGILYLMFSLKMSKQNTDNIGHMAHFSGAIFGIIAAIIYKPSIFPLFIQQLINPPFFK